MSGVGGHYLFGTAHHLTGKSVNHYLSAIVVFPKRGYVTAISNDTDVQRAKKSKDSKFFFFSSWQSSCQRK